MWSPNNRALIRYDPSGQFESQLRIESGLHAPHVFVAGANGDYFVKKVVSGPNGMPENFGGSLRTRQPFNTLVCHAMSNQGYLVVGDNRTYEPELWFPGGSRRRIERAYEPVGITGEERAQWDA